MPQIAFSEDIPIKDKDTTEAMFPSGCSLVKVNVVCVLKMLTFSLLVQM
jgi:hypothetical protein